MSDVRKLILSDSKEKAARRFVISDIHGCFKTYNALLKQIALKKDDYLFILGDAVNRGPDSAAILDDIIQRKDQGYCIFFLRGNHEQIILNSIEKEPKASKKLINATNTAELFDKRIIKEKYHKLLEDSYHYIELEDYFLVHAGFDFDMDEPFENARSMMYIKEFKAKKTPLKGKKIVVGHKPQSLKKIMKRINADKRKIYIDNGCINLEAKGQGNLICFNLDTKSVSIQKNLDI